MIERNLRIRRDSRVGLYPSGR